MLREDASFAHELLRRSETRPTSASSYQSGKSTDTLFSSSLSVSQSYSSYINFIALMASEVHRIGGFLFALPRSPFSSKDSPDHHAFEVRIPQRFKNIASGVPVFFYNYSSSNIHGVFKVLSIEQSADNKSAFKNLNNDLEKTESWILIKIKVCLKHRRYPVAVEKAKPVLCRIGLSKFPLKLSLTEAKQLLNLFGCRDRESSNLSTSKEFPALSTGKDIGKDMHKKHPRSTTYASVARASENSLRSYKAALNRGICSHDNCLKAERDRFWRKKGGRSYNSSTHQIQPQDSLFSMKTKTNSQIHSKDHPCPMQTKTNQIRSKDSFIAMQSKSLSPASKCSSQYHRRWMPVKNGHNGHNGTSSFITSYEFTSKKNSSYKIPGGGVHVPDVESQNHQNQNINDDQSIKENLTLSQLNSSNSDGGISDLSNHHNTEIECPVSQEQQQEEEVTVNDGKFEELQSASMVLLPSVFCISPQAPWNSQNGFQLNSPSSYANFRNSQPVSCLSERKPDSNSSQHNLTRSSPMNFNYTINPGISSVPMYNFFPAAEFNLYGLHDEILEYARMVKPSQETYARVEAAVECVRQAVKSLWPAKDIEVYGSFATGLCLSKSDVDLLVVNEPSSSDSPPETSGRPPQLITVLGDHIRKYPWCKSLMTVENAPIPVIKLNCKPQINEEECKEEDSDNVVAIDITIQGNTEVYNEKRYCHTGVQAREFVLHKLKQFPPLAPLVLLLKSYLSSKKLNNVYLGGLGSYSLTLMLLFFLEHVLEPYLCLRRSQESVEDNYALGQDTSNMPLKSEQHPSLCSSKEDSETAIDSRKLCYNGGTTIRNAINVIEKQLEHNEVSGSLNLGALLISFLHYYTICMDFRRVRIVLQGRDGSRGDLYWQDESQHHPFALWIDDPLRPGVNVGAGSYAMCHVQASLLEMLQILSSITPESVDDTKHSDVSRTSNLFPILSRVFKMFVS